MTSPEETPLISAWIEQTHRRVAGCGWLPVDKGEPDAARDEHSQTSGSRDVADWSNADAPFALTDDRSMKIADNAYR